METSYKKLSKLRDETKFELMTIKRWINEHGNETMAKLTEGTLRRLFELYEIE